jgi:hypothetical protein
VAPPEPAPGVVEVAPPDGERGAGAVEEPLLPEEDELPLGGALEPLDCEPPEDP